MNIDDLVHTATTDLVAAIEAGAAEWRMPWHQLPAVGLPVSVDGRPYRPVAGSLIELHRDDPGRLERVELTSMIETRPGVRSGKPCFIGTRIAVYDVLDYLASGMTTDEIVRDFPELTERHVRVAIEFAAMRERRLAAPA